MSRKSQQSIRDRLIDRQGSIERRPDATTKSQRISEDAVGDRHGRFDVRALVNREVEHGRRRGQRELVELPLVCGDVVGDGLLGNDFALV